MIKLGELNQSFFLRWLHQVLGNKQLSELCRPIRHYRIYVGVISFEALSHLLLFIRHSDHDKDASFVKVREQGEAYFDHEFKNRYPQPVFPIVTIRCHLVFARSIVLLEKELETICDHWEPDRLIFKFSERQKTE